MINRPQLLSLVSCAQLRHSSTISLPSRHITAYPPMDSTSGAPQPYIRHPYSHRRVQPPTPSSDFDTANAPEVRKYLGTYGLVPPNVESFQLQSQRCSRQLEKKSSPLEKYQYLTHLRATNVHVFYRLLAGNVKDITPLIYTPTIGDACIHWHEIYNQPEGMYLSYTDRGSIANIIDNWPHDVEITVVTDGSRILGLGDLGTNGMGIAVGKLSLYSACAGIRPDRTLPLMLDLGTNNKKLRDDPLYMGSRRERVSDDEQQGFMDELMSALTQKWPGIVIQFEDFKNPFPPLARYRDTYTCFNDDIQGTGAVILGGFINAVKSTAIAPKDQRAVFLGAGSAGVGVAKQIVEFFIKEGLTEDEARRRFWLVDSKGLVTDDRGDKLADHKLYFSRHDNEGKQFKTLAEVVEYVRPTILMGMSTIGGAFTNSILKRMGELNDKPIIFPLSNPSEHSECTFHDAIMCTKGRALFASGSPFPALEYDGKVLEPGQGNNMFVFPGIGLGTILCKAVNVTQEMIYASAESLSTSLKEEEVQQGWLYPDIRRIREVSVVVARGVIRAAQRGNVDRDLSLRNISDDALDVLIRGRMYDPSNEKAVVEEELRLLMGNSRATGARI